MYNRQVEESKPQKNETTKVFRTKITKYILRYIVVYQWVLQLLLLFLAVSE
jgi:hypothetical protein